MKTYFKKAVDKAFPVIFSVALSVLIIARGEISREGIKGGIELCINVVIPSLFPFMTLSLFVVKSGVCEKIGALSGKITRAVFYLPKEAAGAILIGLGVKMTHELLKSGAIDKKSAKRLSLSSVNAGPAFIITAVGQCLFGSKTAGVLLFVSCALASLIFTAVLGIIARITKAELSVNKKKKCERSLAEAFTESAAGAGKGIFQICAFVLLFSAVTAFIKVLPLTQEIKVWLCGILEVTTGCSLAYGKLPIYALPPILSFGGVCVFCQIYKDLKETGVKTYEYFGGRIFCCALSFLIFRLLLNLYPNEEQAFSNGVSAISRTFSVSVPTTVCLIITCALLIFEVDRKKKMC